MPASIIILTAIAILLTGFILLNMYFYRVAIARGPIRREVLDSLHSSANPGKFLDESDKLWWDAQPFREMAVQSLDGLALKGHYLASGTTSNPTVIVFHGYRSTGSSMAAFARLIHDELGCSVLLPDARGHGESQGQYVGMGWPDRKDVITWVKAVEEASGPQVEIVLMGISMGGAAVMMAAGEPLSGSVKCIIEDCGYDSVYNEFKHQIKRIYRLPAFPFLDAASLLCRLLAGYSLREASSTQQLQKARVPIFFIHGEKDDFVPLEMVKACAGACASEHQTWIVPGAGHGLSYRTDPGGYRQRIKAWIQRFTSLAESREEEKD